MKKLKLLIIKTITQSVLSLVAWPSVKGSFALVV